MNNCMYLKPFLSTLFNDYYSSLYLTIYQRHLPSCKKRTDSFKVLLTYPKDSLLFADSTITLQSSLFFEYNCSRRRWSDTFSNKESMYFRQSTSTSSPISDLEKRNTICYNHVLQLNIWELAACVTIIKYRLINYNAP